MITEDQIFNAIMRTGIAETKEADIYSEAVSKEIKEVSGCTGCRHKPYKDDPYDLECNGCSRFYPDLYETKIKRI